MKDGFIIYKSFYKPISRLSDKQLGRLFRAIFLYQLDGVATVEYDIEMAFEFFKNQFEIDEQKYQGIVERNRDNGRKGGRKKNPNNPVGFQEPSESHKDNDKDNDKDKENPPFIPPVDGRVGYDLFGKFKNVELKPEELRKLQMDFGEAETQSAIEDLSCKLMDGSTESRAHYATLTYWLASRQKRGGQQQQKGKMNAINEAFD